jgi:hypothetical protein
MVAHDAKGRGPTTQGAIFFKTDKYKRNKYRLLFHILIPALAPRITILQGAKVEIVPASNINLTCNVESSSSDVDIWWTSKNPSRNTGRKIKARWATIQLQNVIADEELTCHAQNNIGVTVAKSQVIVMGNSYIQKINETFARSWYAAP